MDVVEILVKEKLRERVVVMFEKTVRVYVYGPQIGRTIEKMQQFYDEPAH